VGLSPRSQQSAGDQLHRVRTNGKIIAGQKSQLHFARVVWWGVSLPAGRREEVDWSTGGRVAWLGGFGTLDRHIREEKGSHRNQRIWKVVHFFVGQRVFWGQVKRRACNCDSPGTGQLITSLKARGGKTEGNIPRPKLPTEKGATNRDWAGMPAS